MTLTKLGWPAFPPQLTPEQQERAAMLQRRSSFMRDLRDGNVEEDVIAAASRDVNFKACTKNRQNQHKSNRIHKNAKTNTKKGQSQHKSTTILKSDKTDTKKGQSQHNLKIKHDLPKMWTWTWWMGHGGYGGHGHGGPMQCNITQPLPLLDTVDNWTWI